MGLQMSLLRKICQARLLQKLRVNPEKPKSRLPYPPVIARHRSRRRSLHHRLRSRQTKCNSNSICHCSNRMRPSRQRCNSNSFDLSIRSGQHPSTSRPYHPPHLIAHRRMQQIQRPWNIMATQAATTAWRRISERISFLRRIISTRARTPI